MRGKALLGSRNRIESNGMGTLEGNGLFRINQCISDDDFPEQ